MSSSPFRSTLARCGLAVLLLSPVVHAAQSADPVPAATPSRAPLADAAQKKDRAAIRALLDRHADANVAQVDGMTALHWAAFQDDLEAAGLLSRPGRTRTRPTDTA